MPRLNTPQPSHKRIDSDKGRRYEWTLLDGTVVRYPSVTTLLNVISKPYLTTWSIDQVLKAIKEHLQRGHSPHEAMELGRKRPVEILDEAGVFGTLTHELIEGHLQDGPEPFLELTRPKDVHAAYRRWAGWWDASGLEVLEVEKPICSHAWGFAGTIDCIARRPGSAMVQVLDWKTSNHMHNSYLLQAVAYATAYRETTGTDVESVTVVRVGKKDSAVEVRTVDRSQFGELFRVFAAVITLWKWSQEE